MMQSKTYKTVIVDDEQLARVRLKKMIEEFPETFELIGEADSGADAVEKIIALKPDIVFLDIQMPVIDGFEVLKRLPFFPKVIFCTAFDSYALQAFDAHCIDYLVKPLTRERFLKTVEKLNQFDGSTPDLNLNKLIDQLARESKKSETTTIPVKVGDRVIFVRLDEVAYFTADEKYVSIVTKQSKSYILDSSLKKLEDKLPPYFIRVHKSYIVNKNLLKEVRRHFNNRFVLVLDDYGKSRITSGRSYYQKIKELFEM